MSDSTPLDTPTSPNTSDDLTDEEQAFFLALREDLQAYDNPEVFYDTESDLVAKSRIHSKNLAGQPDILRVEIEGHNLVATLREAAFTFTRESREAKGERYDDAYWDQAYREMVRDADYLDAEQNMFYFFSRYFPQLTLRLYDIVMRTAVVYGARRVIDEADKQEMEPAVKKGIEAHAKHFEADLKRMLGTRSVGRPRKFETNPLPEIVRRVLLTARGMMADKRGKDAVPALKGVAINLDTNDAALGIALTRCGHPWTRIKTFLENLPSGDPT